MQHTLFGENDSYKIALLIKSSAFKPKKLIESYVEPLKKLGVPHNDIIGFDLVYPTPKKCPVAVQKAYLQDLLPILAEQGVSILCVADGNYFKTLTGERKTDPHYGYVLPCSIKGFTHMKVVLVPNYQGIFFNPDIQDKVDMGLKTLADYVQGKYVELGENIIHSHRYVRQANEIFEVLASLKQYPELTCDTETLSLQFWKTGVVTISFAWDQHNGVTLWCDNYHDANEVVRQMLKDWFYTFQGTLIYHNANYDMKILVNTLFMKHLLDEEGKQQGIEVLTRKFHDTKIIAYLATNSCTGNELSLKSLAHEFAGNYAQDNIDDITQIDPEALMEYNLVDALSTWYVFNKYFPIMVEDRQVSIYETIMLPSVRVILQMELTGMPICMDNVKKASDELMAVMTETMDYIKQSDIIQQFNIILQEQERDKANAKLKKKVKPLSDFAHVEFNPGSNPNMQQLLYDFLDFPVIDTTDSKAPAVGADTLKKLINHTDNQEYKTLIEKFIDYLAAKKIHSTFISAFEKAVLKSDGHHYLHGNFNLGGTVSGRLSSSGPNLQNIPSTGTKYAKIVKQCFVPPKGWLFMGADFASLEDRISALTTKDPNKLKVYTDGYDGHCLRAFFYFKSHMPDIEETVESINSIKDHYPEWRQASKAPTFLLTYGGTYMGLMENVGLSQEQALAIEQNYHYMYTVSDQWVKARIDQAATDGYVTAAFGLRVRTPLIQQSLMNTSKTPFAAQAEGRTAGNALGQSYGMLNNRAGIDLQERLFDSPYRYDILPVAHIHDAQYFMVRDDFEVVEWLNQHLVECMEWQELPEIQHDEVKLGGELSLFHPSWAGEVVIPNRINGQEIKQVVQEALQ